MKFRHWPTTTSLLAGLAATLLVSAPAAAVDLGEASVLSQQGQKLKVAVPYGSAPAERMAVTRFMVKSVVLPEGYPAVRPESLTLFKPERRNVIFLQSSEVITAPQVKLELAVRDGSSGPIAYNLMVPPGKAALSGAGDEVGAKSRNGARSGARKGGNASTRQVRGQKSAASAAESPVSANYVAPVADPSDLLSARASVVGRR